MPWFLVLNELLTSYLVLKKQLYFWGLVLPKSKKNATVTLTLRQIIPNSKETCFGGKNKWKITLHPDME